MQKKLIALAIAGLAAVPAFAQSNVTIYGRMDFGFMNRSGHDGAVANTGSRHEFMSGGQSGSRIGFKGAEDLGNGLKAIFEAEFGFDADQDAHPTTGAARAGFTSTRHAYVGLTGGFGTAVGGRLDGVRYGVFGAYDPFGNGTVGNFAQMTTQYDRADNAVAYISPSWNGFGLVLAYATNTQGQEGVSNDYDGDGKDNSGDDRLYTIMGTYDNGPLSVKLDYETTTTQDTSGAPFDGQGKKLYVATAGASYDFGMVKISALYDIIKGEEASFIGDLTNGLAGSTSNKYDRRNWLIGAKAPIGKFTVKASYGKVKDKEVDNADANKWAIGVDYALSKRTNLYADYSKISNDSAAAYAISKDPNSNSAGFGIKGFDIGIAHNF